MRREESWKTLLLATATPMQMHPHELWDLVELFDLPTGWDIEAKYEKYYDEVRRDEFNTRQWRFLGDMVHAHRTDAAGGRIDPLSAREHPGAVDAGGPDPAASHADVVDGEGGDGLRPVAAIGAWRNPVGRARTRSAGGRCRDRR